MQAREPFKMMSETSTVGPEQIAANLAIVRERMTQAALKSGRKPESVRLVAVTKYASIVQTLALIANGVREIGESRVQDAERKFAAIGAEHPEVCWHLIGHLQTNKADKALKIFQTVHSIDSLRIAEALNKEAVKRAPKPLTALLEVNVAGEANKYGLRPELSTLSNLLAGCARLDALRVTGLMCMAPHADDPEPTSRPVFRKLRELLQQLNEKQCYPHPLAELSMGMTQDYSIAIEEGATIVRVGSALFQ